MHLYSTEDSILEEKKYFDEKIEGDFLHIAKRISTTSYIWDFERQSAARIFMIPWKKY